MDAIDRAAPPATVIGEGTRVLLAVKRTLKSGAVKRGEQVDFEVAADAFTPDRRTLLISKGTKAYGVVDQSRSAGPFGKPGALHLRIDHLVLSNGTEVPLRAAQPRDGEQGKNRNGAAIGGALAAGLVSGAAYMAVTSRLDGISNQGGGHQSLSGGGAVAFVGAALLTGLLTRGGTATIREGKLFEVETTTDVSIRTDSPVAQRAIQDGTR